MSFGADLTKFVTKTKLKGTTVLRKIALDGLRGVVMMTPVDTGRARGSWRVGINRVDKGTAKAGNQSKDKLTSNTAAASGAALNAGTAQINKAKWQDSIAITNNVPYIGKLERGWSRQAPNGMLRVTFARIKKNIKAMLGGVP